MVAVVDEESEEARVVSWRQHELERAGYHHDLAELLAGCLDVDLHQAVRMVEQGCKPSTACLILL